MPRAKKTKKATTPIIEANHPSYLIEVAHEVCQQVGGIYTVLRSKVPTIVSKRGDDYILVGPYNPSTSPAEFEECPIDDIFQDTAQKMKELGYKVHSGRWLITGKPQVILVDPHSVSHKLAAIKYELWEHHGISSLAGDALLDNVIAFGYLVEEFFRLLSERRGDRVLLAHFHEWMSGSHLGSMRRKNFPITTIFTTHATFLGRCLAVNDENFYNHLPYYTWHDEAKKLNIEPQNLIERSAAHAAHVFTTVSEVTALECKYLLGREVDLTLPNGLNIERFVAEHEFQNLHQIYKAQINRFTMAHFFPSYSFDLDNTLYFFTSGRYEYKNKGFDLTLETLARLNWRLKQANSPTTIVVFFITKSATHHILPQALSARALMDEIKKTTEAVKQQVGDRLFESAAAGEIPDLNELVDEYWTLRLRRNLQAWKTNRLPPVITHQLMHEDQDAILNQIRNCQLLNKHDDKVKIVYHPDFISANNPLFGMDYDQFVRGCHMGIFPSYYEPWGYTPLECIARGIPAVTSDLSGFGAYLLRYMPDYQDKGIYVSKRRLFSWDEATNQLADYLFDFVKMNRKDRIKMRNQVEGISDQFDWSYLGKFYDAAYSLATKRFLG